MKKCIDCRAILVKQSAYCHKCGIGIIDVVQHTASAQMIQDSLGKKTARKAIKAKLSQKGLGRMKGFAKQAEGLLSDVPISSKTFPDPGSHTAMVKVAGVIIDTLQALKELVSDEVSPQTVQLLDEASEALDMELGEAEDMDLGMDMEEPDEEGDEYTLDELEGVGDITIEEPEMGRPGVL